MPRVLAFDVNETLLDLAALDPHFEQALGSAALRQTWFSQMLQLAFVGGLTGQYVDFSSAGRAALSMVAAIEGVELDAAAAEQITGALRQLPPHPDAAPALARLGDAGFTLAALTNSTLEVARAQLEHAGLAASFDAVLSADQVRALKPRPEPYRLVADSFGVPPAGVRLIAAHAWDVTGAMAAGLAAAFVRRPGKLPSPLGAQPDIVGDDLGVEPFRRRLLGGLSWWAATALMLDWHLGMVETADGRARNLGAADALTLARAWLVPVALDAPTPLVCAVAAATDTLDGPLARRAGPTRAGRDLEGLVDACFAAAALRGAVRRGWLPPLVGGAELLRLGTGLGYAAAVYFGRAQAPRPQLLRAARAATAVRAAGLVLTGTSRRRTAAVLVAVGWAASVALVAASLGTREQAQSASMP